MKAMTPEQETQRKTKLQKLIDKHGSAYKASEVLGITPQAFYEQMERDRKRVV